MYKVSPNWEKTSANESKSNKFKKKMMCKIKVEIQSKTQNLCF